MQKYKIFDKIGEGTFSEVFRGQQRRSGSKQLVAIKYVKALPVNRLTYLMGREEINVLRRLSHPNVISILDSFIDPKSLRLCIVTELMSMNLYDFLQHFSSKHPPSEETVKVYLYQALLAVEYIHKSGYFHRDIKPENLLIQGEVLKVGDFGSTRELKSHLPYTDYIATRWYRAPECLHSGGDYGPAIDIWSLGCVMYELLTTKPLFPGSNQENQLFKINSFFQLEVEDGLDDYLDYPSGTSVPYAVLRQLLPDCSSDCITLLSSLLSYDPQKRITAKEALDHPFFHSVRDRFPINVSYGDFLDTLDTVSSPVSSFAATPEYGGEVAYFQKTLPAVAFSGFHDTQSTSVSFDDEDHTANCSKNCFIGGGNPSTASLSGSRSWLTDSSRNVMSPEKLLQGNSFKMHNKVFSPPPTKLLGFPCLESCMDEVPLSSKCRPPRYSVLGRVTRLSKWASQFIIHGLAKGRRESKTEAMTH